MTQKMNSLFDFGEKSLTVEQANNCLKLFKEKFETIKDNQVSVVTTDDGLKVSAIFKPVSKSHVTPKPYVYCEKIESCTGVENMIVVNIFIRDVAKCRSESIAKFNKPNLAKFEKILDNAFMLFAERLEAAHRIDKEMVAWEQTVKECREAVGFNEKCKDKNSYTTKFLYGFEGELYDYDEEQTFKIEIEGLTAHQVKQLGLVIKHL